MSPWEWIDLARRESGCSLSEWSRRAGVGRATLARVLSSDSPNPRAGTFLKILRGAGVDVYSKDIQLRDLDEALILLERERLRSGMSFEAIEEELGIPERRLQRIFRGRANPNTWTFLGLFELFKRPLVRR